MEDLTLGKYIRLLREKKQLSLLELSNRSGVAYAHMSRIENESTMPSPETIVKIANVIDGDLTMMLQKANNLPRVILDRLIERDNAVRVQTLRRAISAEADDEAGDQADQIVRHGGMSAEDARLFAHGIEDLASLRPHQRRAILQLIAQLADDEGDGEQG